MTKLTIAITLALAAGSAGAAPCAVTIARAPEAIRDDVEAALARDQTCAIPLDVRIVETDGGYYVFARDPRGRVREHVAPDAQSIVALVASWAAADDVAAIPPAAMGPAPASPPSLAPAEAPPAVLQVSAPPVVSPASTAWLAFTVALGSVGYSARVDVDLWHRGGFAFGAAGAIEDTKLHNVSSFELESIETHDYRGLATASYSATWDGWRVRAELAAGFSVIDAELDTVSPLDGMPMTIGTTSVFPTADVQLLAGFNLSRHWGLDVGVITEIYDRTYHFEGSAIQVPPWDAPPVTSVSTPAFDWKLAVSLRRSL